MEHYLFKNLTLKARRFRRAEGGNVAMMFGMLLLPMVGVTGLAIDFGSILAARNKGQVAADAAALQASGVARDIIKAGDGSDAATNAALTEAKSRAQKLFKVHADQSGLSNYTAQIDMTRTGQQITTTVSYTVNTTTYIAKLFGQTAYTSSGVITSSSSLPSYVDVYVLMDISQSMGLAATTDGMAQLYTITKSKTPEGCVFGCHVPKSNYPGGTLSNETLAHNAGIKLRVDVMRDAVTKMIEDAENKSYGDSIYRFGLYTMGLNSAKNNYLLNEVSKISGNYTNLKAAATNIDLSTNNDGGGIGDSYINQQIQDLDAKVPNSGDGSSQSKSKVFVFLITDGVRDIKGSNCTSGHCMSVVDSSYCSPYKTAAAGITMGVLYTTYLPIYKENTKSKGLDNDYNALVQPIAANIAPALKACASPNWYYEASDEDGISAAFDKMFAQTSSAPSLTN